MKLTFRIPAGLLFALASATAQNIATSNLTLQPSTGFPICSVTADATMTAAKTPQGYYFDHRTSSGTTYAQDCNSSYTVDITVPGSYNVPNVGNALDMGGGFDSTANLTEANCQAASEYVRIYKRTFLFSWSAWKLVNSQNVKEGNWIPFVDMGIAPYCLLSVPLRVTAPSSVLMTDQYRVMAAPKLYGTPVQARVDWQWSY